MLLRSIDDMGVESAALNGLVGQLRGLIAQGTLVVLAALLAQPRQDALEAPELLRGRRPKV